MNNYYKGVIILYFYVKLIEYGSHREQEMDLIFYGFILLFEQQRYFSS